MYSAIPSKPRSLAVVFCFLFGRPEAFLKVVFDIPRMRACRVISSAKAGSEPEINSAMAVAMSFADLVVSARMASSSAIESPALRPIFEGGSRAARSDIGTFELKVKIPSSRPLKTI